MMKLCDRCTVPGCCLDYLGKACEHAREEHCPAAQPNRAEVLCSVDYETDMALLLARMYGEICEGDAPSAAAILDWLCVCDESFTVQNIRNKK